ncbi:MAG: UDP-2,3-diacylglucosamine diphosphatase [Polaromonas sp.]|nr:UDP-2,3-diacylglucosamine diphosphatase [Polaromonas sp.]
MPQAAELIAPPAWRTVDFISDLHLQASDRATFDAWQGYMSTTTADAVFILGDLFEVWVGDDILQCTSGGFEAEAVRVIRSRADATPVFFMHGNRDFLAGQALMDACSATLLADPTLLVFGTQRWLLSHGDELCIDDVDYMQFRRQVRTPEWQKAFLARPLTERQAIARSLREQSKSRKQSGASYADVDTALACHWLQAADAHTLIHGHTHRPSAHLLDDGLSRVVLSDWEALAAPPRAQVLRLTAHGLQRVDLFAR